MKKRIWAYLLTLVMVVGLLPSVAFAREDQMSGYCGADTDYESFTYTFKDAEGNDQDFIYYSNVIWTLTENGTSGGKATYKLTLSGSGAIADFEKSWSYGGRPWLESIRETNKIKITETRPYITEIEIESGITEIGAHTFEALTELTEIDLPDTVTKVGENAFNYCQKVESAQFGSRLKEIGDKAFSDCIALTDISLPNTLETIGFSAFSGCRALSGDLVIPDSVRKIEEGAFVNCNRLNGTLTLGDSVTSIGKSAFGSCHFKGTLTIPDSVTSIGESAFSGCQFSGILTLGNSLTEIGKNAFYNAGNFNGHLVIPDSATTIEESAFNGLGFDSIHLGKSVTTIGKSAFINCTSVHSLDITELPSNVSYGENAFHSMESPNVVYVNSESQKDEISSYITSGRSAFAITNGGTFAEDTEFKAGELAEPDKDGFAFKGWYTDLTDETTKAEKPTAGQTYYAKWEMEKPQIMVEGSVEKSYDGKEVVLSVSEIEDAAYTWYKDNEEVSSATGNTLTVKNVADSGTYTCQVAINGDTAMSDAQVVSITKATPSLKITPSAASMRGKGTITLTVEGMLADETPDVTCDDTGISVKENGDGTYSVSLPNRTQTYTFTAVYEDNENYGASSDDCTVEVRKKSSSSSSSSSDTSAEKTYTVSKADSMENGKVAVDLSKAEKGDKVTFTVTPDKGYEISKVTVKDADGNKIEVKEKGEGEYTFTMPASKVEIKATFSKVAETPVVAEEAKPILLTIDQRVAFVYGEPVINDVAPIIRNERTMLPIRFVAEALGGTVAWDDAQNKVTITKGDVVIEIFIGSPFATVNGTPVELDAPAFIENSRTYLPLRFVAEHLGATVTWDAATQEVTILPNME